MKNFRNYLAAAIAAIGCTAGVAQNYLDVTLEEAGRLRDALGERVIEIDSLVVSGPINKADFMAMREAVFEGRLRVLDLAEALPDDCRIPDSIFCALDSHGGLRKISMPSVVTEIGAYAFAYEDSLREAVFPTSLKTVCQGAFRDCTDFAGSYLDGESYLKLPEGLEVIESFAFSRIGLNRRTHKVKEIILPSTIREIGDSAFYYSRFDRANFPDGLETIRSGAFAFNYISEVILPPTCLNLEGNGQFANNNFLTVCSIPEGIVITPEYFLDEAQDLVSLKLPSTLEIIERGFLTWNLNLKQLVIPEGVRVIAEEAILVGLKLEKVYLPSTLRYIGANGLRVGSAKFSAFYCAAPEPPEWVGNGLDPNYTTTVYVPRGSKEAYMNAGGGWAQFQNFVEIDDFSTAGIEGVVLPASDVSTSPSKLYDLQGREVAHPRSGQMYIRDGGKIIFND